MLQLLAARKNVDGRGVELSQRGVNECVAKGLSVIQGDADTDLRDYPDDGFDYVILSQTLQATRHPREALQNMLRIGRRAIVSFPNFGYWRVRAQLVSRGRMPVTGHLSYGWHDTPNIHLCTIRDFVAAAGRTRCAHIERGVALDHAGTPIRVNAPWWVWNLFGEQAVFLLERGGKRNLTSCDGLSASLVFAVSRFELAFLSAALSNTRRRERRHLPLHCRVIH